MCIVFYNTNSCLSDEQAYEYSTIPSRKDIIEKLIEQNKWKIVVVAVKPANFLLDLSKDGVIQKSDKIIYDILDTTDNEQIVERISSYNPKLAVSFSSWTKPYDWISMNDSLIAKKLSSKGIKTICHTLETSEIAFDKYRTNNFLKENGFLVPPYLYINNALYTVDKKNKDSGKNVYKEMIHEELRNMNYPIIIKDLFGLSSYGMEIAVSFNQAVHYLSLKKNNTDKIVEEYITGEHFGVEIYGSSDCDFFNIPQGEYKVMNPFLFSTNKYGITSPKQSIKIGPVTNEKFKINELKKELLRLSRKMKFSGFTQIDLIFSNDKWYFIEINSRLSGMTYTYETLFDSNPNELLKINSESNGYIINFKTRPLLDDEVRKINEYKNLLFIQNVRNENAKQEREAGYAEIILGKCNDIKDLLSLLKDFDKTFPSLVDDFFITQTKSLLDNF